MGMCVHIRVYVYEYKNKTFAINDIIIPYKIPENSLNTTVFF